MIMIGARMLLSLMGNKSLFQFAEYTVGSDYVFGKGVAEAELRL